MRTMGPDIETATPWAETAAPGEDVARAGVDVTPLGPGMVAPAGASPNPAVAVDTYMEPAGPPTIVWTAPSPWDNSYEARSQAAALTAATGGNLARASLQIRGRRLRGFAYGTAICLAAGAQELQAAAPAGHAAATYAGLAWNNGGYGTESIVAGMVNHCMVDACVVVYGKTPERCDQRVSRATVGITR